MGNSESRHFNEVASRNFLNLNSIKAFDIEAITLLSGQKFDFFHQYVNGEFAEKVDIDYMLRWSCTQPSTIFLNEVLKQKPNVELNFCLLCEHVIDNNYLEVLDVLLAQIGEQFYDPDVPNELIIAVIAGIECEASRLANLIDVIASKSICKGSQLGGAIDDLVEAQNHQALEMVLSAHKGIIDEDFLSQALLTSVSSNDFASAKMILESKTIDIDENIISEDLNIGNHNLIVILHQYGASFIGDEEPVLVQACLCNISAHTALYILEHHPLSDELVDDAIHNATERSNHAVVDALRSHQLSSMLDECNNQEVNPEQQQELTQANSI